MKTLTPSILIDRLINRHEHLIAYRICEYLQMKPSKVLEHWACAKLNSLEDQGLLFDTIQSKLEKCDVSYAIVAAAAFKAGKKELALNVFNLYSQILLNFG